MMKSELSEFLPYLLNQAAERLSREFQPAYKDRYGMLRTEWRVLFHLGCHGNMTAKQICEQAALHKTKVSRAVTALEKKRFLGRERTEKDRRFETLSLTKSGQAAFADLSRTAATYEQELAKTLGSDQLSSLKLFLNNILSKPVASSTKD